MEQVPVAVVGGGPTGMMLGAELRLAGVEAVVLERRPTAELEGSRAGGFHARTLEVLDQRGVADRFLAEGSRVQALSMVGTVLDVGGLPTRHPYTLGLWQNHVERILAGWADELGVVVRRGAAVVDVAPDPQGVTLALADGGTLRASYVVGADGGRSLVRRAAGIGFPGEPATRSNLVAEATTTEELPTGVRLDATGVHGLSPLEDGRTRIVVTEQQVRGQAIREGEPTLAELRAALVAVFGTDFGVRDPTWLSRFSDATRQAERYRAGRVLLAGDAAHVHPPSGGQGIGLGVQDAVNLGWKLGQVVRGVSPESLLDSYHDERHPVGVRTLAYSMAQALVQTTNARVSALGELVGELLTVPAARDRLAARGAGLDVAYDLGQGPDAHPLVGRRVPDLDLVVPDGTTTRLFTLLHEARPLLLDLGRRPLTVPTGAERLLHVRASYDGRWELPVVGAVPTPTAVLVRPDGHVAWVHQEAEGEPEALATVLTRWCGPDGGR